MLFKKGKLVFTDALQEESSAGLNIPYYTAQALVISEQDGQYLGAVEELKISDLIQKTSTFVKDGVIKMEAHKLYTWPANLGDHQAWSESKKRFLEKHVMNFPIRIISVLEDNHITWEFISPEEFKKVPTDLKATPEFQNYLDHQHEYFFLRQPMDRPI